MTVLCAVACVLLAAGDAWPVTLLRGDVDNDGRVNVADATRLLRYATNLDAPSGHQILAGDVDPVPGFSGRVYGDGRLTVEDAVRILRYSVGLMDAPTFYAGAEPTLNLSQVTLNVNTRYAAALLFNGQTEPRATLSVLGAWTDPVGLGGVTITLTSAPGAPPLRFVGVEPGAMLPEGVEWITTPADLSPGVAAARVAFSSSHLAPFNGYGELFRVVVGAAGPIPRTASYRIAVGDADFADDAANALEAPPVEQTLSAEGER